MTQTYTWEHWDDPNIKNVAEVAFTDDGLTATGTQHGNGYRATWTLDAAEEWITRRVTVEAQGDGWSRALELTRNDTGEWSSDTTLTGAQPADLPSPGIADGVDLSEALDCDLGLCPMTNTMPIRRLNLLTENVPDTQLIMAWIDMPSLQIIASDQYYGSIDEDTVHYRSGTRGVDVELEVDHDGVVIVYPDMARRA
ncbi:hypothetical protein CGLAUT_04550 [Corynebacterium glaucum]|uniref:putative glycolipid-binding domain-containing protein n=1 Tax=Corynebacterium glaucum TaxID=187491 RepID=UPI0025B5ACEC|nr:putative glycolipid-binding domain-containing protein [Corynebacterium glaucum]WJZ07408.1 hypothetical protein CGLAUT_04550 [Corynebacterium glaucum]